MDERQKQVLFLKRLRDTADTAAKNGNMISEEELEEAFADLDLNEDQMTQVRDFLKTKGIGIGEALPHLHFSSGLLFLFEALSLSFFMALEQFSMGFLLLTVTIRV